MKHNPNHQQEELGHLEKQEQKILNRPENPFFTDKIKPIVEKVQDKIPEKLKTALNTAFYKGFQLVFEKGSPYIEKTYNKEKIMMDYDINNYAVNKEFNRRHIKRLDKQSMQSGLLNTSFSVLEGSALGLLGIGIPDIPLFLSVIVKTVYETALSYGFSYDTGEEKEYILLLIGAAVAKGEKQKQLDRDLDLLGTNIDKNIYSALNPDDQMKITSELLSEALLTAKFIQGLPVVGVVGGAVNYAFLSKISNYARIKYKKRYLLRKSQK